MAVVYLQTQSFKHVWFTNEKLMYPGLMENYWRLTMERIKPKTGTILMWCWLWTISWPWGIFQFCFMHYVFFTNLNLIWYQLQVPPTMAACENMICGTYMGPGHPGVEWLLGTSRAWWSLFHIHFSIFSTYLYLIMHQVDVTRLGSHPHIM